MTAQYIVEIQEHDSAPWRPDGVFTRANAWKRVLMAARGIVPGWPLPVWARIYDASGALVYACDLRDVSARDTIKPETK